MSAVGNAPKIFVRAKENFAVGTRHRRIRQFIADGIDRKHFKFRTRAENNAIAGLIQRRFPGKEVRWFGSVSCREAGGNGRADG